MYRHRFPLIAPRGRNQIKFYLGMKKCLIVQILLYEALNKAGSHL